jgi:hypothetical protein
MIKLAILEVGHLKIIPKKLKQIPKEASQVLIHLKILLQDDRRLMLLL